ncbi:MAG: hypothetical protein ACK5WZ_07445 [Pseudobdellovibrionaceae bacterium]
MSFQLPFDSEVVFPGRSITNYDWPRIGESSLEWNMVDSLLPVFAPIEESEPHVRTGYILKLDDYAGGVIGRDRIITPSLKSQSQDRDFKAQMAVNRANFISASFYKISENEANFNGGTYAVVSLKQGKVIYSTQLTFGDYPMNHTLSLSLDQGPASSVFHSMILIVSPMLNVGTLFQRNGFPSVAMIKP